MMKERLLNEECLLQAVRLGVLLERVFGAVGDEGRNLGLSARHVEKCRPGRWSLSSEVLKPVLPRGGTAPGLRDSLHGASRAAPLLGAPLGRPSCCALMLLLLRRHTESCIVPLGHETALLGRLHAPRPESFSRGREANCRPRA